jgi:hypothetical protein
MQYGQYRLVYRGGGISPLGEARFLAGETLFLGGTERGTAREACFTDGKACVTASTVRFTVEECRGTGDAVLFAH